jgi:hypothetical protein
MKKILIFLLYVFLLSCEESSIDPCYTCEMRQSKEKTLKFEFCNKTEEEIHHFEKTNTFAHNLNGEYWYQTTICYKK